MRLLIRNQQTQTISISMDTSLDFHPIQSKKIYSSSHSLLGLHEKKSPEKNSSLKQNGSQNSHFCRPWVSFFTVCKHWAMSNVTFSHFQKLNKQGSLLPSFNLLPQKQIKNQLHKVSSPNQNVIQHEAFRLSIKAIALALPNN